MEKRVKQIIILSSILVLYLAVFLDFILRIRTTILYDFVRILALFGLLTLFISSIMAAFTKDVYQIFGKPFKKIHHMVSFTALGYIILHPVFFAIYSQSADVFLPTFDSWFNFFSNAGRLGLYLILLAAVAGFLQRKIKKWWRIIHMFNYIALLFGVIHGFLVGTDLSASLFLQILYGSLMVISTAAFAFKRYKSIKRKREKKLSNSQITT